MTDRELEPGTESAKSFKGFACGLFKGLWLQLEGHLGRLGGVLIAPRRTLRGILWRSEGHLAEVLLWMVVTVGIMEPDRVGRALLVARVELIDAVSMFLALFADRMSTAVIGAGGGAVVLWLFVRGPEGERPHLYATLDACIFMLIPFLVLAAWGALLEHAGLDPRALWFLPHRPLRWGGEGIVVSATMAFAMSLGLYVLLLMDVRLRGANGR